MPRAAGTSSNYTFVLRNELTGRYIKNCTIELPSVTHVIKSVLVAPALLHWVYQQTLDSVSGALQFVSPSAIDDDDWTEFEYLKDEFTLNEWLTQNKLRPIDIRDEAGALGTEYHAFLESLGQIALQEGDEEAYQMAKSVVEKAGSDASIKDGHAVAIADWWIKKEPKIEESEAVVWSLTHGFCGTVDLIWRDTEGRLVLTDLKNRKAGRGPYDADFVQVGAYQIAWEEMTNSLAGSTIDKRTVLVAREDGTWIEEVAITDPSVFLNLLEVYKELKVRAKVKGRMKDKS